ncbi:hypothetical protein RQP46_003437 [Phenoliferia psychrophenolica]
MSGFFDDDDDDEVNGDLTTSTDQQQDSFFSDAPSPVARRTTTTTSTSGVGARVSSISGRDRTTSSARASSTFSDSRASSDRRPRRRESPTLEDILGEDDVVEKRERNIVTLIRCWANEIAAPEVLPFPRDLVERVVKDLARRREDLKEKGARQNQPEGFYVELALVATENLRASHVLRSYTRERIYKIEKCARYYLSNMEDAESRLNPNELRHAQGFVAITNEYFKTAALKDMPQSVARRLDDEGIVPPGEDKHGHPREASFLFPLPDFSQAVIVRARRDCPPVVTPDGKTIRFEKGTQHLTRYSTISDLLYRDYVELL